MGVVCVVVVGFGGIFRILFVGGNCSRGESEVERDFCWRDVVDSAVVWIGDSSGRITKKDGIIPSFFVCLLFTLLFTLLYFATFKLVTSIKSDNPGGVFKKMFSMYLIVTEPSSEAMSPTYTRLPNRSSTFPIKLP